MNPVMGHNCSSLTGGVRQLLRVGSTGLASISRRDNIESAGREQFSHYNVDIFIQVQLDEDAIHRFRTRGSISSSGTRLRSM